MRDPTLTAMIRRRRQERPDTIAFIAQDRTWTYADIDAESSRAAQGLTQLGIIDFMRGRLAHYKCPKSVDLKQTLPRNPSGKLLKRILREPHWKGHARQVS